MEGFFARSEMISQSPTVKLGLVPKCGACKLNLGCNSPKMAPTGQGRKKILIVAEAPGKDEDDKGIQLVGKSGQRLMRGLGKCGIDMRRDCQLDNTLACRPPNNRKPSPKEIEYCRPHLTKTIQEGDHNVIIPLGAIALRSVLLGTWGEDPGGIKKWAKFQIPCQATNTWICPTYHPSYVGRQEDDVLDRMFDNQLARACKLAERPWANVPDYRKEVEIMRDPEEAATAIEEMMLTREPVAFDYETDRLKPDHEDARIVCCSVASSGRCIAFPWLGVAIEAMKRLLASGVPKIAHNLKFEERWTRRILGIAVNNWWWDSCLAAHILDNRTGVTGLKFLAYVKYGFPPYNEHIEQFLEGKSSNEMNRIKEIKLEHLLLYCGLDSYLCRMLAFDQRKEMGFA